MVLAGTLIMNWDVKIFLKFVRKFHMNGQEFARVKNDYLAAFVTLGAYWTSGYISANHLKCWIEFFGRTISMIKLLDFCESYPKASINYENFKQIYCTILISENINKMIDKMVNNNDEAGVQTTTNNIDCVMFKEIIELLEIMTVYYETDGYEDL